MEITFKLNRPAAIVIIGVLVLLIITSMIGLQSAFSARAQGEAPTDWGGSSVPLVMNYQGDLKDMDGNPLSGYYTVTLRIYASPADQIVDRLFEETHTSVTVRDGRFNVLMGNIDPTGNPLPASLFSNPDRFIGVTVAPYDEMVPRQRLTTVPYAFMAGHSVALSAPDGDPSNALVVDNNGFIGIGTSNPQRNFDLSGNAQITGDVNLTGSINVSGIVDTEGVMRASSYCDSNGNNCIPMGYVFPAVYREPPGCGGGITLSTQCSTLMCAQTSGGQIYLDCNRTTCLSAGSQSCSTTFVGRLAP